MAVFKFMVEGNAGEVKDLCRAMRGFGMAVRIRHEDERVIMVEVDGIPSEEDAVKARTRNAGRPAGGIDLSAEDRSMPAGEWIAEVSAMPREDGMGRMGCRFMSRPVYYRRMEAIEAAAERLRGKLGREPDMGEVERAIDAGTRR